MTQKVAGRAQLVERVDKSGRRPFAGCGDGSGNCDRVVAGLDRGEQKWHRRLALTFEHAVDGALAVRDNGARGEGRAVAADGNKDAGKARFRRFGEIDDLGHVRQIITGERDDIRLPPLDRAEIGAVVLDLKVEQPDMVAISPRRRRNELKPERLKPQKDFRIEQWTRMNPEKPHRKFPHSTIVTPYHRRSARLLGKLIDAGLAAELANGVSGRA